MYIYIYIHYLVQRAARSHEASPEPFETNFDISCFITHMIGYIIIIIITIKIIIHLYMYIYIYIYVCMYVYKYISAQLREAGSSQNSENMRTASGKALRGPPCTTLFGLRPSFWLPESVFLFPIYIYIYICVYTYI